MNTKESRNKNSPYTKEDAYKTLETINMWINSCDTKTSIIMGFYEVALTIFLSSDCLSYVVNILNKIYELNNNIHIIYIFFIILSALIFIYGNLQLLLVLVPRIILGTKSKKRYNSLMFYGSISKIDSYEEYAKKVKNISDENQILNDLLFQIYSASKICSKKFYHQKLGLFFTVLGIGLFIILIIIGILL